LKNEQLLDMYRQMVKIRYFEEKIVEDYAKALVPGLAHLYIGQEAVAVGVCSALEPSDYITSTHRGHGHCIAKGGELDKMMAELFGRKTGYCKGKGGSMHIAELDLGILGANGVVGGGVPIAVGAALSAQMRKSGQVAVAFLGDGASNQGSFHEALNMASTWKLPVVFVCENNLYGISVCQKVHQNITDISVRATGYNIPGLTVEGNDILAVYHAAAEAIARARNGEGPTLLECKTYRWRGHHEGDPNQGCTYREREEIEQWKEKCPLKNLEQKMLKQGVKEADIEAIQEEIQQAVLDAVEFAINSPFPEIEEAQEDIYAS